MTTLSRFFPRSLLGTTPFGRLSATGAIPSLAALHDRVCFLAQCADSMWSHRASAGEVR